MFSPNLERRWRFHRSRFLVAAALFAVASPSGSRAYAPVQALFDAWITPLSLSSICKG
jgi:hypothetical protein